MISSSIERRVRRAIIVFHQDRETEAVRKGLLRHVSWRRAAFLLRANLDHTLRTVGSVSSADVFLCYRNALPADLPPNLRRFPQVGGDLGASIASALKTVAAHGYRHIAVVGTDSPNLAPADLDAALSGLPAADCVIGPSRDGGFFLIAARAAVLDAVEAATARMRWHNGEVLATLSGRLVRTGLRVSYIRSLTDVDRWADIADCDPETAWSTLGAIRGRALLPAASRPARVAFAAVRTRFNTLFTLHTCQPAPPASARP